jgi:hypothetical protein
VGRTIFIYGFTAGILTLALVGAGISVLGVGRGVEGMIWGVASMFVGLSPMFVGVRRYDVARGGLTFKQAFRFGFAIFLMASLVYVLGWEAYLAATNYSFATEYASQVISAKVAEGATPAELALLEADMTSFRAQYANPLLRLPMTFMEIAPVGLIMSLLVAVTMRIRGDGERVVRAY